MNETPKDHTATINRLKGLVPVTEAGREFLALADSLRATASLVESMIGAALTEEESATQDHRAKIEETAIILGVMLFDGDMRRLSTDFHNMVGKLAASKGIDRPRK